MTYCLYLLKNDLLLTLDVSDSIDIIIFYKLYCRCTGNHALAC